ncbi:MAG: tRNA (adenine-N1)-methyltransferase [Candidatus Methanosuratincola sp.]|jgi:tRNA (adenine57-N1/adenine58-N1)-methyltransferase
MKVKSGDHVLLVSCDEKTFLIQVREDREFGTHKGKILHNDIIGKRYGEFVSTHLGTPFAVMQPTLADRIMKIKRRTQIIYPKDSGLIAIKCGIGSGMRVVECGTGSGALTMVLANMVAPSGMVYSYDRRADCIEIARANVEAAGLLPFVEFKVREVSEGFDESDADVVILDLPSPWEGVPAAACSIKGSGVLASISPNYNQVEKTVQCLRDHGFIYIETLEVLTRDILVRTGKTRPADRMIGHTGFLTFARKALLQEARVLVEDTSLES